MLESRVLLNADMRLQLEAGQIALYALFMLSCPPITGPLPLDPCP